MSAHQKGVNLNACILNLQLVPNLHVLQPIFHLPSRELRYPIWGKGNSFPAGYLPRQLLLNSYFTKASFASHGTQQRKFEIIAQDQAPVARGEVVGPWARWIDTQIISKSLRWICQNWMFFCPLQLDPQSHNLL